MLLQCCVKCNALTWLYHQLALKDKLRLFVITDVCYPPLPSSSVPVVDGDRLPSDLNSVRSIDLMHMSGTANEYMHSQEEMDFQDNIPGNLAYQTLVKLFIFWSHL